MTTTKQTPNAHRRGGNVPARQTSNQHPAHQQEQGVARPAAEPEKPTAILRRQLGAARQTIQAMLGGHERTSAAFLAQVYTVISNNPKLMEADRGSLLLAVGEMASLGLSPNPKQGQAYLIPRWNGRAGCNIVDMQLGYRGLLQLVYRSGDVESVDAFVVYKGEHYVRRGGTTNPGIDHLLDDDRRTGRWDDIVGAYAVAFLKGRSRPVFVPLERRHLEDAYGRSGNGNNKSKVWMEHAEAMSAKTALARLCKILPQVGSTTLAYAIDALDREADRESDRGLVYAPQARQVMAAAQPMSGLDGLVARSSDQDEQPYDYGRTLAREQGEPAEQGDAPADDSRDVEHDELAEAARAFDEIEGEEGP
jgi:phage RecT family recombinase